MKLVWCGKRAKQRAQKTLPLQEQMEEKGAVRASRGAKELGARGIRKHEQNQGRESGGRRMWSREPDATGTSKIRIERDPVCAAVGRRPFPGQVPRWEEGKGIADAGWWGEAETLLGGEGVKLQGKS